MIVAPPVQFEQPAVIAMLGMVRIVVPDAIAVDGAAFTRMVYVGFPEVELIAFPNTVSR
jgi:hypothetical protein